MRATIMINLMYAVGARTTQKVKRPPRAPGRWAEAGRYSWGNFSPRLYYPLPAVYPSQIRQEKSRIFSLIDYSSTQKGRPNDQGEWLPSLYCFSLEKWQNRILGGQARSGVLDRLALYLCSPLHHHREYNILYLYH